MIVTVTGVMENIDDDMMEAGPEPGRAQDGSVYEGDISHEPAGASLWAASWYSQAR